MGNIKKEKYFSIVILACAVLFFIAATLMSFKSQIQERMYDLQVESMEEISMQGSAVVEKNLESLSNTLYGLAEYMTEEDILAENTMERLQHFLEKRKLVEFQRLGLADAQGNSRVTNGESINISDRKYFQTCIQQKEPALEVRNSELVEKRVIILAIPILRGEEEQVIGVLYGVMELASLSLYENTLLEDEEQFIQIIDKQGNYILKEETELLGKWENIFDGLGRVKDNISVEELKEKLEKEEQVFAQIWGDGKEEIVFFSPLKFNDWCVVTIMDQAKVIKATDYILDKDVYWLTIKIIAVLLLLSGVLLYYLYAEKRWIQEYNKQLMFNEQIFQIASQKAEVMIAIYSLKTRELRFINNKVLRVELPQKLENAPEEIKKYLGENLEAEEKLNEIFNNIDYAMENKKLDLNVIMNGEKRCLRIQFFCIVNEKGELSQSVGLIEDITEENNLRKAADTDQLTALYNRRSGAEKIQACLQEGKCQPGIVHACMILDLDYFKTLNDTLGHQMGDQALQDVARILTQHFREYDVISRLGGDEFSVFMKNIPENVVEKNVASLLKKLHLEYSSGEKKVFISASAGVVLVREPQCELRELYHQADEALYQVKHEKRGNYRIVEQGTKTK